MIYQFSMNSPKNNRLHIRLKTTRTTHWSCKPHILVLARIQDTSEQPTMTGLLFTLKNKIQMEFLTLQYRSILIQNRALNNRQEGRHSLYKFLRWTWTEKFCFPRTSVKCALAPQFYIQMITSLLHAQHTMKQSPTHLWDWISLPPIIRLTI